MALATWWRNDPLPVFAHVPGFRARLAGDDHELSQLNGLSLLEVRARREGGHRPYVGYIYGEPVTYGWVAMRAASIGELSLTFRLPATDRYLWDFATRPEWQGRGLYPRLLAAIVESESRTAQRLWIIHSPENLPSGAGMSKAGFTSVGQLSFQVDGSVGLAAYDEALPRATVGARLLGVPLVDTVLAPCWCCGATIEQRISEASADSCWPPRSPAHVSQCSCAVTVKPGQHSRD